MDTFYKFISQGFWYVADIHNLTNMLFLSVLLFVYTLNDFRRGLVLSLGLSLSAAVGMILVGFSLVSVKANIVMFSLVGVTSLMAVFNIFGAGNKPSQTIEKIGYASVIVFGVLCGMSVGKDFGGDYGVLFTALCFCLGFALGAVTVGLVMLSVSSLVSFFGFNRRDFALVFSAIVIGVMIPYLVRYFPFTLK